MDRWTFDESGIFLDMSSQSSHLDQRESEGAEEGSFTGN